jgi:ActR/RegA family two-component response regulator
MRGADLDGLADLAAAAGAIVVGRCRGRPPLDDATAVLVWDVGIADAPVLAWLRMLVANRPGRKIILLESFPRAETTLAALQAGAVALLGRPCGVEALAGTLLALSHAA